MCQGAFGVVYHANLTRDDDYSQEVAVKLVKGTIFYANVRQCPAYY